MVRPSMGIFDEIYTEEEWIRARVGDVSSASPASLLIQFAPPNAPDGTRQVLEAHFTWTSTGGGADKGNTKTIVSAEYSSDPNKFGQANPIVMDLVDRFTVFKYERDAQRALEKGDSAGAQEKLGVATKRLRAMGENALASDMEEQISAIKKKAVDTKVLKRVKATTRRLASNVSTSVDQ